MTQPEIDNTKLLQVDELSEEQMKQALIDANSLNIQNIANGTLPTIDPKVDGRCG